MSARRLVPAAALLLLGVVIWTLLGGRAPHEDGARRATDGSEGEDERSAKRTPELDAKTPAAEPPPAVSADDRSFRLRLRVLDPNGRPAAGLEYRLITLEAWNPWWQWSKAAKDGFLEEEFDPQESFRIAVRVPGHVAWLGPWREGKGGALVDGGEIWLSRAESIAGRVVGTDGLPVAASLDVAPEGTPPDAWWALVTSDFGDHVHGIDTDEEGGFEIDHLPPGVYSVGCRPDSGAPSQVVSGVRSGTKDLRIRVSVPEGRRKATWSIRALDPQGEPVPTFQARVTGQDGDVATGSGQDGLAVVSTKSPPPFTLVVDRAQDARRRALPLAPAVRTDLTTTGGDVVVHLRPGAVLEGRVAFGDEPVRGKVGATYDVLPSGGAAPRDLDFVQSLMGYVPATVDTDANGRFRLDNLPPGEVLLTLVHDDLVLHPEDRLASTEGRERTFRCERRARVDLRVRAPPGERLTAVEVELRVEVSGQSATVGSREWKADGEGSQEVAIAVTDRGLGALIAGAQANAVYAARVTGRSGARVWPERRIEGLTSGAPPVEVALRAGEALRGRVVDADGQPIVGARVFALRLPEGDPPPATWQPLLFLVLPLETDQVRTGRDGLFEFAATDAPYHLVTADAPGRVHAAEPLRVRSGDVGDLVLGSAASLSGNVETPGETPCPVRWLIAWSLTLPSAVAGIAHVEGDGHFRFAGLRPGRYRVAAAVTGPLQDPGPNWALSEAIETGHHGARVPLLPGRLLRVRVVDSRGSPSVLSSVRVTAPWVSRAGLTEEDGEAVFGALPRSPLEVTVRTADGRRARRTVAAEEEDVEISL